MSSRAVLFGALLLLAGCRRQEPIDCEQPPSATGCTFDAECELVVGGCCGEAQVPAPARKTERAQAWVDQCGSRPPCPSECAPAAPQVAHCVKGVCLAVARAAPRASVAGAGAGRVDEAGAAVMAAAVDAGAGGAPGAVGAGVTGTPAAADGAVAPGAVGAGVMGTPAAMDAGVAGSSAASATGAPAAVDAGARAQGPASCSAPPPPPSCQQDADCDVVSASVGCCEYRFIPVAAGATVPAREWVHQCVKRGPCERQCELPDVYGGRCVKGACAAVVTRVRPELERRPWDTKTPRRGVITAGKPEPLGKKALTTALQKWLKARVPAIEACFTKALQGQPVGPPATRVLKVAAEPKGLTVLGVEGTDALDELAAGCPEMTLEDAGRPAGVAPRTRVEFSWTLTFTGVAARGRTRSR